MTWGQQNTEAEAHAQLGMAADAGVTTIDTAEIYPVPPKAETAGRTDQYISTWLKQQDRSKIVICTKVAGYGNAYLRKGGAVTNITPDQVVESVDQSLARLGVDCIDLIQIHWPSRPLPLFGSGAYDPAVHNRTDTVPFEDQLAAFQKLQNAGKIRYLGVSNETSYGIMRFLQASAASAGPKIISTQNSYSLLVRSAFETDLAEVCYSPDGWNVAGPGGDRGDGSGAGARVGLLAYSPLAGGTLSGKYVDGSAPVTARLNLFEGYMARYNKSLAKEAVAAYVAVAKKHDLTPTQLALAWCAGRWCVSSTIIGATSTEQLAENLGAFDISLSEECLEDIEKVYARYRDPTMKPMD
jgi:aryl-alcohol dehydrogenase-like predicted oxidoreductase